MDITKIKTILRYPGGKSKAVKFINSIIPINFLEFREPFVGGGSVFIDLIQNGNSNALYKINDLNYDLYCFWKYLKEKETDGRKLFRYFTNKKDYSDFDRAVRFFVLNRITFSGIVDSGGYSEQAFEKRFTLSSIEKIKYLSKILASVEIYNKDYEELLFEDGKDVFIFLDPPYYTQAKSRLYGNNGILHTSFNHRIFAENMKKCNHKWLITLDDCEENRKLFSFANIYNWTLQYGMNNYKKKNAAIGKELFVSNYDISKYNFNFY